MMTSEAPICLACMNQEDTTWQCIKEENKDFETLRTIYTELTTLKIDDDDNFPKHICPKCSNLLDEFKSFKEICIKTYQNFKNTVLLHIKDEDDNSATEPMMTLDKVKLELALKSPVSQNEDLLADSDHCEDDDSSSNESLPLSQLLARNEKSFLVIPELPAKKYGKRKYKCTEPDCNSQFTKKSVLELHEAYHRGKGFECNICQKKMTSLKTLQRHIKTHKEDSKTKTRNHHQFQCTVDGCMKSFLVEEFFLAHKRSHEGISPNTCDICNKEMASVKGMLLHRLTHKALEERHKTFQCQKCFKKFSNNYRLQTHLRHHEIGKNVICDECGMTFHDNTKLKLHQKSHNTEATFTCEFCPKAYKTYNTLYSHKQTVHGFNKPDCKCLICNKEFSTTTGLYKHRKIIHTVYTTTENIFACNLCEVKCKDAKLLKEHVRLHTGERKFACTLCPKTFAHRTLLNRHAYFHSGERPVHCEVCQKGFYTKHALNIHMNIHKRAWIAEGVQGIELFGYCRNKNKE